MCRDKNWFSSEFSMGWLFFVVAYLWSWGLWIPAALVGQGISLSPVRVLYYLGGLGPLIAGIGLACLTHRQEYCREYVLRLVQFKRIGLRWYAVILLTVPIIAVLAIALDIILGGDGANWEEATLHLLPRPWSIVPFALFTLIFGPLPEELGWRGFALDRLQARWSALGSSLILGAAWTLWHLPLFFIGGTFQFKQGIGSIAFWLFMLDKAPQSILMTWIYNHTRRSTLSAVLFHFMVNFVGELLALTMRAEAFQIFLWIFAAGIVTVVYGAKTMTRE